MPRCRGIGWDGFLNRILKMWPDERFVTGEKTIGGYCRVGSFQVKHHPKGFIDSTDDVIFSTEPGV